MDHQRLVRSERTSWTRGRLNHRRRCQRGGDPGSPGNANRPVPRDRAADRPRASPACRRRGHRTARAVRHRV